MPKPNNRTRLWNIAKQHGIKVIGWPNISADGIKKLLIENFINPDDGNKITGGTGSDNKTKQSDEENAKIPSGIEYEIIRKNGNKIKNVNYGCEYFKDGQPMVLNEDNIDEVIEQIIYLVKLTQQNLMKNIEKFGVITRGETDTRTNNILQTTILKIDDLIKTLKIKLNDAQEKYEDESFVINNITVNYSEDLEDIIAGYNKSCEIANDKWIVIDSVTIKNCVFVAIYTAMNWDKNIKYILDEKYRKDRSKRLKQDSGLNDAIKNYTTIEDIHTMALTYNINIIVYDNNFEVLKDYNKKAGLKIIEIMIEDCHAKALIKKEDLNVLSRDIIEKFNALKPNININKCSRINMKKIMNLTMIKWLYGTLRL